MKLKRFKLFKEAKSEKPYTNFDWSEIFHHDDDYLKKLIKTILFKYDAEDISDNVVYKYMYYKTTRDLYEIEDYKILPGTEIVACYYFDDVLERNFDKETELEESLNKKLNNFGLKAQVGSRYKDIKIFDIENTYEFTTEDFLNFFSITDYRISEKGGLWFQVPLDELVDKFVSDRHQEEYLKQGYIEADYWGDYPDRESAIDYYINKENLNKICLYLRKEYGEELKELLDLDDNYTDKDILNHLSKTRRRSFDDDNLNDIFSMCVDYYNDALRNENYKDLYNEFIRHVERDIPSLKDLGWVKVNGNDVRMFEGAFELDNPSYIEPMDSYVKALDEDGNPIRSNYYDTELYRIVFEYLGDCSKSLDPHYSDYPHGNFEEDLNKDIGYYLNNMLKKLEGKEG